MVKIDSVLWGKVRIASQEYHQALIIGEKVLEREKPRLERLFGTTHKIGNWEQKLLLSENPEVVLVATGWSGVLKVGEKFKKQLVKKGIELKTVLTPKVISEYNRLIVQGKRVNVLIHTTC